MEKQDVWFLVSDTIGLSAEREKQKLAVQQDYAKEKVKYQSDSAIDAILQIPIEDIFASDYGLQIKKTGDKYNFVRP